MENIKINFSLEALRAKRAELARIQHREYETRGNTQRAQELWEQITKLDEEIEMRESSKENYLLFNGCAKVLIKIAVIENKTFPK